MTSSRATRLVATGLLCALPSIAAAEYTGVTYEIVDVGAPPDHTTYRFYASFDEPTNQLLAVSSEVIPIYFWTDVTLANDGGVFSGFKEEDFAQQPVSASWDSYITIDADEAAGNDTDYRPNFLGSDGIHAVIIGQTWIQIENGGWFDSNPGTPALAGDDLRILIAQFTVENAPDGSSRVVLQGTVDWQPGIGEVVCEPFAVDTAGAVEPGACNVDDDTCLVVLEEVCAALGGVFLGEGSTCGGACCRPNGTCFEAEDELECDLLDGTFQGFGTACEDGSCPGACCLLDGSCQTESVEGCAALGGVYRGFGTTCPEADCSGACCLPDGSCIDTGEAGCADLGGDYRGDGSSCLTEVCAGACCLPGGSCIDAAEATCDDLGGEYQGDGVPCSVCPIFFTGVTWEIMNVGAPEGHTTYRFYANFSGETAQLLAVSSELIPLFFWTNITLANDGGVFSGFKEEDFAQQPVSAPWDSYVTIDADQAVGNDTDYRPGFLGSDGVHAVIIGQTWIQVSQGGWFDSNPGTPALAGEDLRALIAQYTVENDPDGSSQVIFEGTVDWQPDVGQLICEPFLVDTEGGTAGACCFLDGTCEFLGMLSCETAGGFFQGEEVACFQVECTGGCCLESGACVVVSGEECLTLGGAFGGPGTTCDDLADCVGACCLAGSVCEEISLEDCASMGGLYLGLGTDCVGGFCEGACCLPDGSCIETPAGGCTDAGGLYAGDGSSCLTEVCSGACCLPDGSCVETGALGCTNQGGDYRGDGSSCLTEVCAGACCLPDGTCVDTGAGGCADLGGAYRGDGSSCATESCSGACCLPDGACVDTGGAGCVDLGGQYRGDGSSCATESCGGACCLPDGSCADTGAVGCADLGGSYRGDGTTCATQECAGACCLSDSSCIEVGLVGCGEQGGLYLGDGTSCVDGFCPGACCLPDGSCVDTTLPDCEDLGGAYRGDATTCLNQVCLGACCLPDASCIDTGEAGCAVQGGDYRGDGSSCLTEVCAGACCLPDGSCIDAGQATCEDLGGEYQGDGVPCTVCPIFFTGVTWEIMNVGAPAGHTTYRFYANFSGETAQLLAVSSELIPLFFWTNITLANDGGVFSGFKEEDFAQQPVSASWDSYVTIDADQAAGNDTDYRPGFLGSDGVHAVIIGQTWIQVSQGGWFDSNPGTPALAGEDLRALIAQFTVENDPDGSSHIIFEGTVDWQPGVGELICEPFLVDTEGGTAGACCFLDGTCEFLGMLSCESAGGFFQGEDVACFQVECSGGCCLESGACVVVSGEECLTLGGAFGGPGTTCDDLGDCVGACCLAGSVCEEIPLEDCASMGGLYLGLGTGCVGGFCEGACCLPDGSCLDTPSGGCADAGGLYAGDGTSCSLTECMGACCLPDGSCADTGEIGCADLGGAYRGGGTACASEQCLGACCFPDASCLETGEVGCLDLGGVYAGDGTMCTDGFCFGACCLANAQCVEISELDCSDLSGVFAGPATFCSVEPCCPSDIDGDGLVGFLDLVAVLAWWGPCPACPQDIDHDGIVGMLDLNLVLASWGPC